MKIKINDGKGKRIVTEIKRPDPKAVLIIEEGQEIELTNAELNTLIVLKYVELQSVSILGEDAGKVIESVYPNAIVYKEPKIPVAKKAVEIKPMEKIQPEPKVVEKKG